MVKITGHEASAHNNEHVVPSALPTEYYVAHLFLLRDEPGPNEVTPFYFASVDLCELTPYLQLMLNTPPSFHGYVRRFHHCNYVAAGRHRFSHFLITCYARNFDAAYAETFAAYLVKVVYVPPGVPLGVLQRLSTCTVPPIVIAGTSECMRRAEDLRLPCWLIDLVTPEELNIEIGQRFSTPAAPLTQEQCSQLEQGKFDEHIPPNVFVATLPEEHLFADSHLHPYPASGLRLLFPNEVLSNHLRRRCMPKAPPERPDPANNLERAIQSMQIVFAQRLADYLLNDPRFGLADATLPRELRDGVEKYIHTDSADAYEQLVIEARRHLTNYPGACEYILCCPAINKKSSERIFKRTVPDRVLKNLYKAKAQDYQTYIRREDFRSGRDFQQFTALMMYQSLENAFLSTVLALYAVSYRKPVLRTPHLSSGLFGKLRHLSMTYSGGNRRAFVRDLWRLGKALSNELAPQVRKFLASTRTRQLKLISDLPLEWIPVNNVPLMFQRTLSRLPLTPGNTLYAHFNACREDVFMGPAETNRVLIVNCIPQDDDVYAYAKAFLSAVRGIGLHPAYVEPTSVEEYAAALRTHKPYILVHWGHGSYDGSSDRGYLHVRDQRTEVWDLRGCAIPPIVLLASCETAAIAETHNTPANGWLALGARSVLATFFPVQADLTSVLYTRIFANLLEAVHGRQRLDTWAIVVSKTLILNRYLDFFYGFVEWRTRRQLPQPPREVFLEYTYLWNQQRWSPADGYRGCPELLAQAINRFGKELGDSFRQYLRTEVTVPHTMFFTHLGAPETIVIRKEPQPGFETNSPTVAYWRMRAQETSNYRRTAEASSLRGQADLPSFKAQCLVSRLSGK